MKNLDVKALVANAMIACVYAVMTLAIEPLAYGAIQLRISEILMFLAFYNRKYITGLVLGCFIANLFSPLGLWDICFGTLATLLACIVMNRIKNIYAASIAGGIINGVIVGLELTMVYDDPFVMNLAYVFIGEVIVLLVGTIIFKAIAKNESFMKKYILN